MLLAWVDGRFDVSCSAGIIANLEEKLSQDRITRRYSIDTPETVRAMQLLLSTHAGLIFVGLRDRVVVTGDPEGDYVLATARLAGTDYLVTGDKGLLALGRHAGTRIITPRAMIDLIEGTEAEQRE